MDNLFLQNKSEYRLRIWEIALLAALCISMLAGAWAQKEQSELADGIIRLHVIADSDEEYEQQLKLRIRDSVLETVEPLLESAGSRQQAQQLLGEHVDEIEAAAAGSAEGRPVTAQIGLEYYPTRYYEGFSLPAGRYISLKITVGEGKGSNWWCVVFPPLCNSAVEPAAEDTVGLDENEIMLITENGTKYVLKFRILELWGEVMDFFSD